MIVCLEPVVWYHAKQSYNVIIIMESIKVKPHTCRVALFARFSNQIATQIPWFQSSTSAKIRLTNYNLQ